MTYFLVGLIAVVIMSAVIVLLQYVGSKLLVVVKTILHFRLVQLLCAVGFLVASGYAIICMIYDVGKFVYTVLYAKSIGVW